MFKRNVRVNLINLQILKYVIIRSETKYCLWMGPEQMVYLQMLYKAQACGCHLPYDLRKPFRKRFKGHMNL